MLPRSDCLIYMFCWGSSHSWSEKALLCYPLSSNLITYPTTKHIWRRLRPQIRNKLRSEMKAFLQWFEDFLFSLGRTNFIASLYLSPVSFSILISSSICTETLRYSFVHVWVRGWVCVCVRHSHLMNRVEELLRLHTLGFGALIAANKVDDDK